MGRASQPQLEGRTMLGDKIWQDQVDRVVERAAIRISNELEKMIGSLPKDAAPQMAMELLGLRMIERQPQLVAWLDLQSDEAQAALPLAIFFEELRLRKGQAKP